MIRGSPTTECLGQVTGGFIEPTEVQIVDDQLGSDVHYESWCPEGENDGELCRDNYVELSTLNNFLRLCEVRVCS